MSWERTRENNFVELNFAKSDASVGGKTKQNFNTTPEKSNDSSIKNRKPSPSPKHSCSSHHFTFATSNWFDVAYRYS